MENCNMAKDIVQEAVEQAEAMKEAAYENAKSAVSYTHLTLPTTPYV